MEGSNAGGATQRYRDGPIPSRRHRSADTVGRLERRKEIIAPGMTAGNRQHRRPSPHLPFTDLQATKTGVTWVPARQAIRWEVGGDVRATDRVPLRRAEARRPD